jgi:hypothetical protein
MFDSVIKPVSDVAFVYESFPVKMLHIILTLAQIIACFKIVSSIFVRLVPAQVDSVDAFVGYVVGHLWTIAIGILGIIIGGLINLWLTRGISRFLMKHANNHTIIAVILDALFIWGMAQSLIVILPPEVVQQIQEAVKSVAPNLGM